MHTHTCVRACVRVVCLHFALTALHLHLHPLKLDPFCRPTASPLLLASARLPHPRNPLWQRMELCKKKGFLAVDPDNVRL